MSDEIEFPRVNLQKRPLLVQVSIASLAGLFGNAKLVDYCASKFAAVGIAESLILELDRCERSVRFSRSK